MIRFFAFLISITINTAFAEFEVRPPKEQHWSFQTPLGTFDRASLQRGFQVYKEVCAACHGLSHIRFRELSALGFNDKEIKVIASGYSIQDGPNEEGEMFERPGTPGDAFPEPYPNEQAARAANGGAWPADLSLIVKAREGGANYVHSLLTGYETCPKDITLFEGKAYNPYFEGGQISMPPPLTEGQVTFSDGTPATVNQMSKDVVTFLAWASEPELESRRQIGLKVILYLIVFSILMYFVYRSIWRNVK
jgi:ubiquinol-cytochrome c reductase cytochrome c1 subunit